MALYTEQELESYLEDYLWIMGDGSDSEGDAAVREQFIYVFNTLPDNFQTLLIGSRQVNITGNDEAIQELYRKSSDKESQVNGFFQPGKLTAEFKKSANDAVVWKYEARGRSGDVTARHETGHRADYVIGIQHCGYQGYWSDYSETWNAALYKEISHQQSVVNGANGTGLKSLLPQRLIPDAGPDAPLYYGHRELLEHLSYYDNEASHSREAFAEMSNHHLNLIAMHEGDEEFVDQLLSKKYPHLWPVYRDEFIPLVNEYADDLLFDEQRFLKDYVASSAKLRELMGRGADQEKDIEEGRRIYVSQRRDDALSGLNELIRKFSDPIGHYVQAKERLQDEYNLYDSENYSDQFDFEAAELEAQQLLNENGRDHVVFQAENMINEQKYLARYVAGCERFSHVVRQAFGERRQDLNMPEILQNFQACFAEGSEDDIKAVKAELVKLTMPSKALKSYVSMREQLEEQRWEIQHRYKPEQEVGSFSFDTESVKADIVGMMGPLSRKRLEDGQVNCENELRALRRFDQSVTALEDNLNDCLSDFGYKQDGQDMLNAFDAMYAQGGRSAIQKFRDHISVNHQLLNRYIHVREEHYESMALVEAGTGADELGYHLTKGHYRPFDTDMRNFPDDFEQLVGNDMLVAINEKGEAGLLEEIEQYEHKTHELLCGILGVCPEETRTRGSVASVKPGLDV